MADALPDSAHVVRYAGPALVDGDSVDGYEADPSHSEIEGLPAAEEPHAALIGDLIAECVRAMHPAVP